MHLDEGGGGGFGCFKERKRMKGGGDRGDECFCLFTFEYLSIEGVSCNKL